MKRNGDHFRVSIILGSIWGSFQGLYSIQYWVLKRNWSRHLPCLTQAAVKNGKAQKFGGGGGSKVCSRRNFFNTEALLQCNMRTTTYFFTHHILSTCLETFIRGTNFPRQLHLVQPKDPVDPRKQDGVVYKTPSCECSKIYIGKMGRCIHEQIEEYDKDIWLSWTQTSATSEHANKTKDYPLWDEEKLIDQDPHELKRLFT